MQRVTIRIPEDEVIPTEDEDEPVDAYRLAFRQACRRVAEFMTSSAVLVHSRTNGLHHRKRVYRFTFDVV